MYQSSYNRNRDAFCDRPDYGEKSLLSIYRIDPFTLCEPIWKYIEFQRVNVEELRTALSRLKSTQPNGRWYQHVEWTDLNCRGAIVRSWDFPEVQLFRRSLIEWSVEIRDLLSTPEVTWRGEYCTTTMCFRTGRICGIFTETSGCDICPLFRTAMRRFGRRKQRRQAVAVALAELQLLLPELDPLVVAYTGSV